MKCIVCGQEIREDLKGGMHIHCYEGLLGGEKGGK